LRLRGKVDPHVGLQGTAERRFADLTRTQQKDAVLASGQAVSHQPA